jgi:hypothetical protein
MHRGSVSVGCATSPIHVSIYSIVLSNGGREDTIHKNFKCAGMIPSAHGSGSKDLLVLKMNQNYIMYTNQSVQKVLRTCWEYILSLTEKKRVKLPQTQSKDGIINILFFVIRQVVDLVIDLAKWDIDTHRILFPSLFRAWWTSHKLHISHFLSPVGHSQE